MPARPGPLESRRVASTLGLSEPHTEGRPAHARRVATQDGHSGARRATVLHALAGIAMATTKSSTMTHDDETATSTEENKLLVGARLLLHCTAAPISDQRSCTAIRTSRPRLTRCGVWVGVGRCGVARLSGARGAGWVRRCVGARVGRRVGCSFGIVSRCSVLVNVCAALVRDAFALLVHFRLRLRLRRAPRAPRAPRARTLLVAVRLGATPCCAMISYATVC